ncbi:iron dicitrate transport regulator FecR [Sulfurimonas aquatica]|uniref:Iron dicitrate transport regulator FecR n=1 Tax=Sulfurimonas aquatica TaxID=2672570 RepID=A0A975GBS2_9BACT|nr:FecR family protein [Sulfurimonas aquatica]QSZ40865.1 iron dicitrate transport regulator FecR [Sulfurimonas aquatica]
MKLFIISLFLSLSASLIASTIVGSVQKVSGIVKVKSTDSIKKSKIISGFEIKEGDLISTSRKASAVIALVDGSSIVLDASSSVHFKSAKNAEQTSGKVYYKITSRDAKNTLKVKTPFAIIGIKGTIFVVNASENGSVTLKEGLIGVTSIKEEFELYRKSVEAEFNSYLEDQMSEFEKFKNDQNKYAKPIKTKAFDLKQGNKVSFSDKKVHEDQWTKEDDAEFDHFESLINAE